MNDESTPKGAHESATTTPMITVPTDFVHEPSAWLRGAAARRVRQINAAGLDVEAFGVVVAPLGRTGPPGSRADRECDRCCSYVPEGDLLHLVTYRPTARILLAGGLCSSCARKEGL